MKSFLSTIVLVIFSSLTRECLGITPIPANFTIIYHRQPVDHFSFSKGDSFLQRIIISTDHWGGNGSPIFFYTGNEGNIFMFANNTGFMWDNAKDFKAMVVFAEHRYYGVSLPYGNDSFSSVEKVGYLTTEQALADFALNIEQLKVDYKAPKSPVILFGGSYGGMLASWFRMKYPHLAIGALAASAPILQFPGIYNCSLYYQVVTKDFAGYSDSCPESIRKSWSIIRKKAKTEEGRKWLNERFSICEEDHLKEENEVDKLIIYIRNAYESMSMTDYPNAADFLQPLPPYPIKEACRFLSASNADEETLLGNIYSAVSVFYNYSGQVPCTSFTPNEMDHGWNIQACSEMVMPICANGKTDMFEPMNFDLKNLSDYCFKKYGIRPQPTLAIREWGGRNLGTASNIIFSNGDRDPWSVGGVLSLPPSASKSLHVINISHACHHEDLRSLGPNDTVYLIQAREQEKSIIQEWIKQYKGEDNDGNDNDIE